MRSLYLIIFLCIFVSCIKITDPLDTTPGEKHTFLEGQQIPGTEIFFPLGFNDLESRPKVSPGGNFIVYQDQEYRVNSSAQPGLYILDLSTSTKRLLIAGTSVRNADWSPDGQWIAFNNGTHIYKIKANSDSLTQLTTQGRNFFPDWSPDGQWIAYDRSLADASGPEGIWVMRNDGSEKRWVGKGAHPSWHFSNQKIVGIIGDSLGYKRLIFYHINPDSLIGTSEFKNTTIVNHEYSPDGSRITCMTGGDVAGIWIIDADGSDPKRILAPNLPDNCCEPENGLFINSPSWFPGGIYLIYEHFKITGYESPDPQPGFGPFWEGYYSFYKVNVDSALAISNLP